MSCVDADVVFSASFWVVDPVEVSLAVIFGLLVGIVIAIIVARCFFQELAKERVSMIFVIYDKILIRITIT